MEGVEGGAGDEGGLVGYPEVADGVEGVGEEYSLTYSYQFLWVQE